MQDLLCLHRKVGEGGACSFKACRIHVNRALIRAVYISNGDRVFGCLLQFGLRRPSSGLAAIEELLV